MSKPILVQKRKHLDLIDNVPSFDENIKFITANDYEDEIIYERDPATNKLIKVIIIDKQPTDYSYTANQEYLLMSRQGDHYNRIADWIPENHEIVQSEYENMNGYTTLNEGDIWKEI